MNKNIKILKISFLILSFLIISCVIYILIPRSYIKIDLAPQEAFLKIDNIKQSIKNGDKLTIKPGKHSLVFFRDGFQSHTESIDISNSKTINLTVVLIPITDQAKALLNNDVSNKVIEKYTGLTMDQQVKTINSNYPIVKILPIDTPYYRIYTCSSQQYPNNPLKIAVCITMDDQGYKQQAYDDIKAIGYDLNNYEVIIN